MRNTSSDGSSTPSLPWADLPGTLPTPWNAGFVGIGWISEDFPKIEVQQRKRMVVLDIQEVPLQGLFLCPRQVCQDNFFQL
jgi:hypothetical protein